MSYLQIILILKKFKDFFPYKIVFDATHHYPENIQKLFACIIVSAAKHPYPEIFKDFCASRIVLFANHLFSESIQGLFRLQNWLRRKSSLSWNYSRIFSPAKLSYAQIIIILKIFNNFFACKNALAANHHYPENIQRLFRLQNCLKSKSSLSWKYSKTFSPAKLFLTEIIKILKTFKDLFACKNVLAENNHYPGNIQILFCLQKCLSCKSSLSWKNSKTFSPAKLSWPQIIKILEIFKDFFAGKIVLAANHRYPENFQRFFRLQKCLNRKSSLSWKYSKTFSPAKLS